MREASVEPSSSPTLEADKKSALPSKNDSIDYEISNQSSLGNRMSFIASAAVAASIIPRALDETPIPPSSMALAIGGFSILAGAGVGKLWYGTNKETHTHNNTIEDKELGFMASRLVYKGSDPINVDGKDFPSGSNFFFVELPSIYAPDLSRADLGLQLDVYNHAIRQVKKFASEKSYDFVALQIGSSEEDSALLPPGQIAKKGEVLKDKGAEFYSERDDLLMLSKEQFEALSATINELFERVRNEFGDPIFNQFVDLARIARGGEERERIKTRMLGRLDAVLRRELESNFNALPEVVITRIGDTLEPVRRKVYVQSMLKETPKGFMFIQINTTTGETGYVPVNQLLKTKDKPIDEIIASKSHLKKGQLALILREFLTESEIDDLLEEEYPTREELIEKLKEMGLRAGYLGKEQFHIKKINPKKRMKTKLRTAAAGLAITASGIGAMTTIDMGVEMGVGAVFGNRGEFGSESNENVQNPAESVGRLEFPGIPERGIEWEIGGNISPNGYYMTGTSSEFKDKRWIENTDIDSEITIPTEYNPEDGRLLTLSRPILLNQFGETSFKLPIRENTLLMAISLKDPDGNPIDRTVYKLTDGSIKVVVTPSLLGTPAYADVVSSFTQNSGNMIHATEPLPILNKILLSEAVLEDIAKASTVGSDVDAIEYLRTDIQNSHLYSLDPPDKEKLEHAHSHEDVVNAIEDLSGCSCEICNSQLVLSASLVSENETVNMAYGYIAMDGHLGGSEDNYLKSETRHAFGIQQDGIIIDATARIPAEDEKTQRYIELLTANYASSVEDLEFRGTWDDSFDYLREEAKDSKEQMDFLKLLAGVLAGGSSAILARQLYTKGRRTLTAENIEKASDQLVAEFMEQKVLSKAYNFFSWLSWAKPEFRMNLTEPVNADNNVELFKKIKGTISYDKIALYAEDPTAFERIAREHGFTFTKLDKMKLRMLANYLLKS